MKLGCVIALAFSLTASGFAAPALVQPPLKVMDQVSQTSDTMTINCSAGSMLVVIGALSNFGTDITVSSPGLAFQEDVVSIHYDLRLEMWSAPNVSAGNHTVTITCSQSEFIRWTIMEFSGIAATSYVAGASTGFGPGTTIDTGTVTATAANTLLVAGVRTDGDDTAHGTISVGSNFTAAYPFSGNEPEQKLMAEYRVTPSAGTFGNGFTMQAPDGGGWVSGLVAYMPSATVDPPPTVASIVVGASGTTAVVTFSETVTVGAGGSGGFTLVLSGGTVTMSNPSGSGATRTFNTLSRVIGAGETGTGSYVQPGNGFEDSANQDLQTVSSLPVTNNSTVAPAASVTFSPVAGPYFGSQNITLSSLTPSNTIRYTIDGSTPTGTSPVYSSPISISAGTTIKAFAAASGFINSPVTTADYEVGAWSTGSVWKNFAVPQETGSFTWIFRANVSSAAALAPAGMSPIASTAATDLGPIILFDTTNVILARNGPGYEAVNSFPYVPNTTYEFVLTINVVTKRYNATVSTIPGTPMVIASNYAFRTEQAAATELDNVGMLTLGAGTINVSQMSFTTGSTGNIETINVTNLRAGQ